MLTELFSSLTGKVAAGAFAAVATAGGLAATGNLGSVQDDGADSVGVVTAGQVDLPESADRAARIAQEDDGDSSGEIDAQNDVNGQDNGDAQGDQGCSDEVHAAMGDRPGFQGPADDEGEATLGYETGADFGAGVSAAAEACDPGESEENGELEGEELNDAGDAGDTEDEPGTAAEEEQPEAGAAGQSGKALGEERSSGHRPDATADSESDEDESVTEAGTEGEDEDADEEEDADEGAGVAADNGEDGRARADEARNGSDDS